MFSCADVQPTELRRRRRGTGCRSCASTVSRRWSIGQWGETVKAQHPEVSLTELDDAEGFWGFFAGEGWEPGLPGDVGIVREIRTAQVSLGRAPRALRQTVFGCNRRQRRDGYETVGQSDRVVCWRLRRIGAVWSWRLTLLARQWSWRGAWRGRDWSRRDWWNRSRFHDASPSSCEFILRNALQI